MRIPIASIALITPLVIIVGSNPTQMSATTLFLVLCLLALSVVIALYRLSGSLKLKSKGVISRGAHYRFRVLAVVTLLLIFVLNIFGALSMRDVLLSLILAGVVGVYLSKYSLA